MFRYAREVYLHLRLASDRSVEWANVDARRKVIRMVMEVVVSLIVLGVCLYGLLSAETEPEAKKYFSGFAGTVIGYWLH